MYGAECVDHYIVTAAREGNAAGLTVCDISSNQSLSMYTCEIPNIDGTEYNFTVYSVTNGVDSAEYDGDTASDCCKLQLHANECHIVCF